MTRKPQITFVFLFLVLFTFNGKSVSAHGVPYYDLNPDKYFTKPLLLSSVTSTVALLFQPQNDFLSSFDFWFDNNGQAGTVTFRIKNSNGTQLAVKTISVGQINPISGGVRTHADLTSQLQVSNLEVYKIEISANMPNLRIYHVNRVEIVGHQEGAVSPYLIGVTKIGNAEQIYTFKYGVYEVDEEGAPKLYATSTQNLSPTQTKIIWRANEPIDYKIEYGLISTGIPYGSTTYNGSFTSCGEGDDFCFVTLSVLPGSTHFYNLTLKDQWENAVIYQGTFTSEAPPLATPTPEIVGPIFNGPAPTSQIYIPQNNPTQSPNASPPLTTYDKGPENILVDLPKAPETENYVVTIIGKRSGFVATQTAGKNETRALFQGIPSDTYKIEVQAISTEKKVTVVNEEVEAVEGANFRFYMIIGGIVFILLIIFTIAYHKYKEYI